MNISVTTGWDEYELVDSGAGRRLERFGKYVLDRPDPEAMWEQRQGTGVWQKANAIFKRTTEDKGQWIKNTNIPEQWLMGWKDLKFYARLTPFKHTGVFPEQAGQWEWIKNNLTTDNSQLTTRPRILNLFGYTGIATLVCAKAGAEVVHVDASKPAIGWARENLQASGLGDKPVRWILDDALEFTAREERRGNKYDGIIMDPPAFGHGPTGKAWQFNRSLPDLLKLVRNILTDKPLFLLINAYAVSVSSVTLGNLLSDMKFPGGKIETGELGIKQTNSERVLSTGIWGKWSS